LTFFITITIEVFAFINCSYTFSAVIVVQDTKTQQPHSSISSPSSSLSSIAAASSLFLKSPKSSVTTVGAMRNCAKDCSLLYA
jgi:hypothetical protein